MKTLKSLVSTGSGLGLLLVAVICLNIVAAKLFFRVDVTAERVFSLSEGTKRILGNMDRDVTARLYFSRSLKELPPVVKTYATRVEEVLNEYKTKSGGHLKVEVVDPKPDTDDEEWAQKYGVNGVRLPRGDQMYFGIVFVAGSKEVAIPYLDPRREEFLEYDLSEALVSTSKKERAKVGIMSSFAVMGAGMMGGGAEGEGDAWAFVDTLKRNFDVEQVSSNATDINAQLRVLIMIHPKGLADGTLYAVDQFLLGGGRLIVAVDPMSRTDLQVSGSQARATGQMPQVSSSLEKLFATWNVEFDSANMVGDPGLATQINAGGSVLAYPYFMTLNEAVFTKSSVITGKLQQMLYAEGGALAAKKDSPYGFEPLITTTKDSGTGGAMMAAFMNPQDLAKDLKSDGKDRVLAALVRGTFKSAFPEGRPQGAAPKESEQMQPKAHKSLADAESQIVIIADADFLADANAADKLRFGNQVMVRPRNDNLNFLFNAVDYLGGNDDLIAIRSHGRIARPFTRVTELQKDAQKKWQAEEEVLTSQLTDLQKKLNDLQSQRTDGNRMVLSTTQQGEIARFREDERKIKVRRREVRKNLREDIEALGHKLAFANLLLVPVLTAGFGVGVFVTRTRKRKERQHG